MAISNSLHKDLRETGSRLPCRLNFSNGCFLFCISSSLPNPALLFCHCNKVCPETGTEKDIGREGGTVCHRSDSGRTNKRDKPFSSWVACCPLPAKLETCFSPPSTHPIPQEMRASNRLSLALSEKEFTSKDKKVFPLRHCQTKIANEFSLSPGQDLSFVYEAIPSIPWK